MTPQEHARDLMLRISAIRPEGPNDLDDLLVWSFEKVAAENKAALEAKNAEIFEIATGLGCDPNHEIVMATIAENAEARRIGAREIAQAKEDRAAYERWTAEIKDVVDVLRADNAKLTAALDRYRYVYAWWTADSCDFGGEFRSRMHWARGEDYHHLSNDEVAAIGQQFLKTTGRRIADEQTATGGNK